MANVISSLFATLITVPILGYLFIFIIGKRLTKNHRKAVHMALDSSTILFILSVHYLLKTIWGQSYLSFIFLFMLVCAIIFVIIHWKLKGEIIIARFLKGYWRFNFLVFFLAYLGLTIYGLIHRISILL